MPKFDSFEQLEAYLRGFTTFRGSQEYDFVGVATLALSLLDNLRDNALEADLENLAETVTVDQAAFIVRLASHMRRSGETE